METDLLVAPKVVCVEMLSISDRSHSYKDVGLSASCTNKAHVDCVDLSKSVLSRFALPSMFHPRMRTPRETFPLSLFFSSFFLSFFFLFFSGHGV